LTAGKVGDRDGIILLRKAQAAQHFIDQSFVFVSAGRFEAMMKFVIFRHQLIHAVGFVVIGDLLGDLYHALFELADVIEGGEDFVVKCV